MILLSEKELYNKLTPFYYELENYIDTYPMQNMKYGPDCMDLFHFKPYNSDTKDGFTFLNHGAFW